MENTQSVASLMESTTSKIQQLQKAFAELESHRAVTLNLKWKELEEHFHGLERSLKRRFHELEDQEKEFETKTRKARELLEKKEAAVVAKEKSSLQKLQQKRDTAVFAITSALEKHKKVSSCVEPVVASSNGTAKVQDAAPNSFGTDGAADDYGTVEDGNDSAECEVKCYPQLIKLCQDMDAEGLHKFVSDNRKNLAALKEEIPSALKAAANPASLVLDSLEGFYQVEVPNADGKKDSNLLGIRRTCIMLMECLNLLFCNLDPASLANIISEEVKKRAKAMAEGWRPKLEALDVDASNGNSLEAHAFLQLLATFGIASGFKEEELSRLIPMVSRRRQAADLCRSLGLSEKMPGVIQVLVKNGRQIDAVNLAFAFELTVQFSPVHLLKSYLNEARKAPHSKQGSTSPTAQDEFNERELTALKAVIKCIEEHNLEEQYPIDPLQKRVHQLEKAKADKKRGTEVAKPQPKRPRANPMGPRVINIASDKTTHARVADMYPHYIYDNRPLIYAAAPADNRTPPAAFIGTPAPAAYNFAPSHPNFFGNCYQYPTPYFH